MPSRTLRWSAKEDRRKSKASCTGEWQSYGRFSMM